MQQMVARQVDMGTYAGPSFIIGHDKGGLVAIAVIEHVGRTASVVARKDLGIKKLTDLKGKKIANQTGSSIGNIFVDQIGPANGLKKGDLPGSAHERERHDRRAVVQDRGRHGQCRALQRDRRGRRHRRHPRHISSVDKVPVFMAATPDFVEKSPDTVVAYLKAWLDAAKDFKQNPKKVSDMIYSFYASKGYKMSAETFAKAIGRVDVDPGFPHDLAPYMAHHADVLLKTKKISKIPDWKKALRTEFMDKAKAGS